MLFNSLLVVLLGVILLQVNNVVKHQEEHAKRLDRLEAKMIFKKQKFEDYKNYIESKYPDDVHEGYTRCGEYVTGSLEDLIKDDNVMDGTIDIKEVEQVVCNNSFKSKNIRATLSHFTVEDVQRMFY